MYRTSASHLKMGNFLIMRCENRTTNKHAASIFNVFYGPELKCKSGLVTVEVAKVTGSCFHRRLLSCSDESPHNSSWVSNLSPCFNRTEFIMNYNISFSKTEAVPRRYSAWANIDSNVGLCASIISASLEVRTMWEQSGGRCHWICKRQEGRPVASTSKSR